MRLLQAALAPRADVVAGYAAVIDAQELLDRLLPELLALWLMPHERVMKSGVESLPAQRGRADNCCEIPLSMANY